jgi:hypothetical protein
MSYYYINKNAQENGDHEVHTTGCSHPPEEKNRIGLGNFDYCYQAVVAAKQKWPNAQINGCYYCANSCNTG